MCTFFIQFVPVVLVFLYLFVSYLNAVDWHKSMSRKDRVISAALFSAALILAAWLAVNEKV